MTDAALDDYEIETDNGVRHWLADSKEHASEQHWDAFGGDPGEDILRIARWDEEDA